MKALLVFVCAFVGSATVILFSASEALAQAKGGAARSSGVVGGAKVGGTVAGVKSPAIVNQNKGVSALNQNKGVSALNQNKGVSALNQNKGVAGSINRATRPISGGGANNIIISSGFGGAIYGGFAGYGGYPGNSGFSPYLSGYPFTSSILPLDYAYTPYAGPTLVDPSLNNVRGYPPTAYPNTSPKLYPGATLAPGQEFAPSPRPTTATVQVAVPTADAELWFNGVKTQTQGMNREFVTPELSVGQTYTYEMRVKWILNGKQYDQTRSITLQAGSQIVVSISVDGRETLALPPGIKI